MKKNASVPIVGSGLVFSYEQAVCYFRDREIIDIHESTAKTAKKLGSSLIGDFGTIGKFIDPASKVVEGAGNLAAGIGLIDLYGVVISNEPKYSQIAYLRYNDYLSGVDTKEELVERYTKLYTFVEKCVKEKAMVFGVDLLCENVIESTIGISDYDAYNRIIEEMDDDFIRKVEADVGNYNLPMETIDIHHPQIPPLSPGEIESDSKVSLWKEEREGSVVTIEPDPYERFNAMANDLSK